MYCLFLTLNSPHCLSSSQNIALARNTPLTTLVPSLTIFPQENDQLNSQLTLTGLSLLKDYLLSLPTESPPSRDIPMAIIRKFEMIDLENRELVDLILSSRPPCRWQEIEYKQQVKRGSGGQGLVNVKINIVLDIAHNQPAIEALMEKVKTKFREEERRTKIRSIPSSLPPFIPSLLFYSM
jgi:folylpolyglutamate synthase/dihydropteroate synthase